MKNFLLSFLLFSVLLHADTVLDRFIEEQTSKLYVISIDANATETTNDILQKRYSEYGVFLDLFIKERQESLESFKDYSKEIFYLHRKIEISEQRGNNFSVLRDRIKINDIRVRQRIQEMLRGLIVASYEDSLSVFRERLEVVLAKNMEESKKTDLSFTDKINELDQSHKVVIQAQESLKSLHTIIRLNDDLRKYIRAYRDGIYKTTEYDKSSLVEFSKEIGEIPWIKAFDPILEKINLDSTRFVLIVIIIIITFSAGRLFYFILNYVLRKLNYLTIEVQFVLKKLQTVIFLMIVLYGFSIVVEVYLGIGASLDQSGKLFKTSYVILGTYMVYRMAQTIAILKIRALANNADQDTVELYRKEVINLGIKFVNFFIIIIGILLILNIYGIDLAPVLSALGIGSLAIAFAAKDTLSNFFGSVSILLDEPFAQGDLIEIDGQKGHVIEVGIRSTTLRSGDNSMMTIPNLNVANATIINWSKRQIGRPIRMSVGVTYESNFDDIRKAVDDIRTMLQQHPNVATEETGFVGRKKNMKLLSEADEIGVKRDLKVHLHEFSASSIDIFILCYSISTAWDMWLETKEDVMYKIADILKANNLSFAYPALSVHLSKDEKPKAFENKKE